MTREQINQAVIDAGYGDEELLLADGFEDACLGIAVKFNTPFMLYDRDKCIEILMTRDGMSRDDAEDYFGFNVQGAYVGEHTPAYLCRFSEEVNGAKIDCDIASPVSGWMQQPVGAQAGRRPVRRRKAKSKRGPRRVRVHAVGHGHGKNVRSRPGKVGGRVHKKR